MRKRYLILAAVVGLALCVMLAQSLIAQGPAGGGRGGAGAGAGAPGGAPGGGAPGGAPGGGQGRGAPGGAGGGGRGAAPEVPVVKGADGKPDFTGYYMAATTTNINQGRGVILDDNGGKTGKIPYNAEWEAKAADTAKNHMFDEPYAHCLPAGVPTNFGIQMGFQIVQGKNQIVFAWDTVGGTRTIHLDDRKHIPASMKLYQGDSIGHWEGDVLVVDTTSIAAGWWDASGAIHSDQTHVVERFSWAPKAAPNEKELNGNRILYEATVEDPVALTKPWKMSDNFNRNLGAYPNSWGKRPTGYEQTETACVEGDMDMALYPVSSGGFSKDSTTGPSAAGVVPGAAGGGRGGAGGGGRGGAGGGAGAPGGGAGAPGGGRGAPGGGGAPGAGAPAGGQR